MRKRTTMKTSMFQKGGNVNVTFIINALDSSDLHRYVFENQHVFHRVIKRAMEEHIADSALV